MRFTYSTTPTHPPTFLSTLLTPFARGLTYAGVSLLCRAGLGVSSLSMCLDREGTSGRGVPRTTRSMWTGRGEDAGEDLVEVDFEEEQVWVEEDEVEDREETRERVCVRERDRGQEERNEVRAESNEARVEVNILELAWGSLVGLGLVCVGSVWVIVRWVGWERCSW